MKSSFLAIALLLTTISPAFGAELPFDKAEEFPAKAYDLVADKRVVWMGEMHGSQEGPRLFLGLVRLISQHHKSPPVVALEIPTTEQQAIDRYLATGEDAVLRASPFFGSEVKDGRSSVAMVQLLSQLRTEKVTAIVCFDTAVITTAQERDTAMAQNLQRFAKKYPDAKLVVLSGNLHAKRVDGVEWDPKYRPAAFELGKMLDSLVTFDLAFESGTIWALTEKGFAEMKVRGERWNGTAPYYINLFPQRTDGYDGAIFTRKLTGSPAW